MESLVPAFVAALLAGLGDRPAWRVAALASQPARHGAIIPAAVLAQILVAAVAAIGGAVVAPHLTPNARDLILGGALLSAGLAALWPTRSLARPAEGTAAIVAGSIVAACSDRAAFVTFALAARGPSAVLAGVGGAAGGIVLAVAAASLGERGWRSVARRSAVLAAGAVLALFGAGLALQALRLI